MWAALLAKTRSKRNYGHPATAVCYFLSLEVAGQMAIAQFRKKKQCKETKRFITA
jgi:hypothetical protein